MKKRGQTEIALERIPKWFEALIVIAIFLIFFGIAYAYMNGYADKIFDSLFFWR